MMEVVAESTKVQYAEQVKIDDALFEKYRQVMMKDPNSQVFAPLAEGYRERGLLNDAYRLLLAGTKKHPKLASGFFTLGKVLKDSKKFEESLGPLRKAIELASENILAHQTLAEVYLQLQDTTQALRSYKMVLFLNPNSQAALRAIQKLESFSADEYEDEVFSMERLTNAKLPAKDASRILPANLNPPEPVAQKNSSKDRAVTRMLSLIDAFIVRGEVDKAWSLLQESQVEFGSHPELARRIGSLKSQFDNLEELTPLEPLQPRQEQIRDLKLRKLQMMLSKINEKREAISL